MSEKELRLSDLVEREHAEELAREKMPNKFKWELNRKTDNTTVPEWIIEAMIEFGHRRFEDGLRDGC